MTTNPQTPLVVLSLGAGVQSSTLALMAVHGQLDPMPDCAIFANTHAEPDYVYEWLDWLETQLPFPLHRVSHGNLYADVMAVKGDATRFAAAPFFTESDNGGGRLRRQCTNEYKIQPLIQAMRRLVGLKKHQRAAKGVTLAIQYIGISTDEFMRVKPARVPWLEHRWPLIDKGMSREDCLAWLEQHDYPWPNKSACTFCPYHDDATWQWMRDHDPQGWQQAVEVDEAIRGGVRGTTQKLFVHRSLTPLNQAVFSARATNKGELLSTGADEFNNECEGMCGI